MEIQEKNRSQHYQWPDVTLRAVRNPPGAQQRTLMSTTVPWLATARCSSQPKLRVRQLYQIQWLGRKHHCRCCSTVSYKISGYLLWFFSNSGEKAGRRFSMEPEISASLCWQGKSQQWLVYRLLIEKKRKTHRHIHEGGTGCWKAGKFHLNKTFNFKENKTKRKKTQGNHIQTKQNTDGKQRTGRKRKCDLKSAPEPFCLSSCTLSVPDLNGRHLNAHSETIYPKVGQQVTWSHTLFGWQKTWKRVK